MAGLEFDQVAAFRQALQPAFNEAAVFGARAQFFQDLLECGFAMREPLDMREQFGVRHLGSLVLDGNVEHLRSAAAVGLRKCQSRISGGHATGYDDVELIDAGFTGSKALIGGSGGHSAD